MKKSARDIAASYGMTTADRIPQPPPRPAVQPDAIPRLTAHQRETMRRIEPAALALVVTEGPLSVDVWGKAGLVRRLGHNRAVFPATIARTTSWADTVTPAYDKSPVHAQGMAFRVWLLSDEHRDRLFAHVIEFLSARADRDGGLHELRKGFRDLGPDCDLAMLEMELHAIAERQGFKSFDDDGLVRLLDRTAAAADAIRRGPKPPRDEARLYEMALDRALGG